jgi:hypothetical protein
MVTERESVPVIRQVHDQQLDVVERHGHAEGQSVERLGEGAGERDPPCVRSAEGVDTWSVQALPSHQRQRAGFSGSAYQPGGA